MPLYHKGEYYLSLINLLKYDKNIVTNDTPVIDDSTHEAPSNLC